MSGSTYCPELWQSLYIHQDGAVYACCHLQPAPLGNLHDESLERIWNGARLRQARHASLSGGLGCFADCTLLDKTELGEPPHEPAPQQPRYLKILFGERCNIACVMCFQDHESRLELPSQLVLEAVNVAQIEHIDIQGGEPLMISAAREFADHLFSLQRPVNFLTNGLVMTDRWAELICRYSDSYNVSLNAATRATHEKVNRGSDWRRVLKNIERIRTLRDRTGSSLEIHAHMTLVEENVQELPLFIRSIDAFGVDSVGFGYDRALPAYLDAVPRLRDRIREGVGEALAGRNEREIHLLHRLRTLGLAD